MTTTELLHKNMGFILVITLLVKGKYSKKVGCKNPLGFPYIIDVGSTTSMVIGKEVITTDRKAEFLHFGCQSVWCSATLMVQLVVDGLR